MLMGLNFEGIWKKTLNLGKEDGGVRMRVLATFEMFKAKFKANRIDFVGMKKLITRRKLYIF